MRFRGGLVVKAHRLCVSINSRLESNKEEERLGMGTQQEPVGAWPGVAAAAPATAVRGEALEAPSSLLNCRNPTLKPSSLFGVLLPVGAWPGVAAPEAPEAPWTFLCDPKPSSLLTLTTTNTNTYQGLRLRGFGFRACLLGPGRGWRQPQRPRPRHSRRSSTYQSQHVWVLINTNTYGVLISTHTYQYQHVWGFGVLLPVGAWPGVAAAATAAPALDTFFSDSPRARSSMCVYLHLAVYYTIRPFKRTFTTRSVR